MCVVVRVSFLCESASGVRSNGLCRQSVFAAGGLVPVGFKHSWRSTSQVYLLEKHSQSCAMATLSECEREAREAAANLALSTVLPHSVSVLKTLDDMRETLSYDSIGCKQALPIFEELVNAGQEPVGEDYPPTKLEHCVVEWLDRREAAPDTPPVKPQSPRQPIYLSVKKKASDQPESDQPESDQPGTTPLPSSTSGSL